MIEGLITAPIRRRMEDRSMGGRSRPSRAGLRPPVPLSPDEEEIRDRSVVRTAESALQRPTARPAVWRTFEPDLGVEDCGAPRDADLANDQPSFIRDHPDLAVVASAERADNVAEVGRIPHGGEGIA